MNERKLLANVLRTPDGTVLQSCHVHDYVEHVDANGRLYMIDGGVQYIRRTWYEDDNGEDLSVYTDDPHSKIREWFRWGTYGKEGKGPLTWKKLKFLSTNHIQRILDEGYARAHLTKLFQDELAFRKGKPLAILVNGIGGEFYKASHDSSNYHLRGICASHEGRPDLVNQWILSSAIVEQLSDNTYETLNTIYNVISLEEAEVESLQFRLIN
jgi:hypothetical protein